VAFLFSELADFAVYQPLRERRWLLAVFASNAVGLGIDSILFPQIAFGSLHFIEGQIIEKLWTTVFAVVVLLALRRWVILRYSRPADNRRCPRSPSGDAGPPGNNGVPCLAGGTVMRTLINYARGGPPHRPTGRTWPALHPR
jgi:hypothetical protein